MAFKPPGVRIYNFQGTTFGLLACYKFGPMMSVYRSYNAFFRKSWMSLPLYGFLFTFAYTCSV